MTYPHDERLLTWLKQSPENVQVISVILLDLRSPVANLLGATELLAEDSSELDAIQTQQLLKVVRTNAERLKQFHDELYSALQSSKQS